MKTKKKYKLKTWPKVIFILLILIGIASYFGYQYYQDYLYRQSQEYFLLELGYDKGQTECILKTLNEEQIEIILNRKYNEFIPEFIKTKYFMFKNLDGYLSQVITQEDDFFKYHGVEGYDYEHIVAKVNTNAAYDFYTETKKVDLSMNEAILVNKYNELDINYEPEDLVNIDIKYRYDGEKKVRKIVYDAFLEMWDSAYNDGIYLIVDSGYRSGKKQDEVYKHYEDMKGTKYADLIAARPGFSEHQTGLAIDIYSKECADAKKFKDSKTYKWLMENAYKFGFILRYPEGKKDLTGYEYESWHFRYLGTDLAKKVYESELTYDEYYAYYLDN